MIPCILFEDEHLLVANKPAGMNTHAPAPYAGEGLYDWLRHREPRWANLAIVHRLDKETSGVMVFGKTPAANRSLTEQFTRREARKRYVFLTDRRAPRREFAVRSPIARSGNRYAGRPGGEPAETRFRVSGRAPANPDFICWEAEPLTGRTHQIRVHAAESGLPVLGDVLYGGTAFSRVCLHAAELVLRHPVDGRTLTFRAEADFSADVRMALRAALIDFEETDAFRLMHGASDGWAGWYLDRVGAFLLSQSDNAVDEVQMRFISGLVSKHPPDGTASAIKAGDAAPGAIEPFGGPAGAYHKRLNREIRGAAAEASPRPCCGEPAPERFFIRENGVRFEISFSEGYSIGLFFDQRDNRRRFLTGHVAAGFHLVEPEPGGPSAPAEMLNAFAYTCGFSVCAAKGGMRATSLDLSKKYLEWGKRNFAANDVDATQHDFIYGDVFDWMQRLRKKGRRFDVIALDPPTFSQSKQYGVFRAEKDYGKLVHAALPLLRSNGVLFASANAAKLSPEKFLADVERAVAEQGRSIIQRHYAPQPPDFPISRGEPGHLKTVWLRIAGKTPAP